MAGSSHSTARSRSGQHEGPSKQYEPPRGRSPCPSSGVRAPPAIPPYSQLLPRTARVQRDCRVSPEDARLALPACFEALRAPNVVARHFGDCRLRRRSCSVLGTENLRLPEGAGRMKERGGDEFSSQCFNPKASLHRRGCLAAVLLFGIIMPRIWEGGGTAIDHQRLLCTANFLTFFFLCSFIPARLPQRQTARGRMIISLFSFVIAAEFRTAGLRTGDNISRRLSPVSLKSALDLPSASKVALNVLFLNRFMVRQETFTGFKPSRTYLGVIPIDSH